jgi:hypothetical protein
MMLLMYSEKTNKYYLGTNTSIALRAIARQTGEDLKWHLKPNVFYLKVEDTSAIKQWRKKLSALFINQPDPFYLGDLIQTNFPELLL